MILVLLPAVCIGGFLLVLAYEISAAERSS
jgi:hypothetical protein